MKTPDGRSSGPGGLMRMGRGDIEGQGVPLNQFVLLCQMNWAVLSSIRPD